MRACVFESKYKVFKTLTTYLQIRKPLTTSILILFFTQNDTYQNKNRTYI